MFQDYIQYIVFLDEGMYFLEGLWSYCLDSFFFMEVFVVFFLVGGCFFFEDESQVDQDLVVVLEIFVDQFVNGLLIGIMGVMLQSLRVGYDDVFLFLLLLFLMQNN